MEEIGRNRKRYGLVGRNIAYSFSKGYFSKKFKDLGLKGYSYENFDLRSISEFGNVIRQNNLHGLNVTIPYKQEILPFLDHLEEEAKAIGAVNTIKFVNNKLVGYNTDAHGFQQSLIPLLGKPHTKALILGTGGASKAVAFVLHRLNIDLTYVSRSPKEGQLHYTQLRPEHLEAYKLIINCSPVGTYPKVHEKPDIPYAFVSKAHILYDLIYNPEETAFLTEGKNRGATIQNGWFMLQLQAEKAWEIWNA
ncbi:MAG: shikimate dehydrogenase [Bacteroidota bacterium]